ncbi:aldehyde dehydrogenase [Amycolatopsis deserti]|uniref:Aldehyde dehydrogenase n=1 Tax=Amycolatopsis deserti TaxID=185696 RepID=A0ABQ3IFQ9_9PSEU|nr:aldehyde dehydrogenase family protein [Amycolatopsis deserti]GHE81467.1 aldehyde dehydrogenase [Amycolatopsis deserti]
MRYSPPGTPGSSVSVLPRYDNFIGGEWLAPTEGRYRAVVAPATAGTICETADSSAADLELALDAAHVALDVWRECSRARRAEVLTAVADAIEDNAELLAVSESWETGRPIREALGVDIPLAADHFRNFAAVVRGAEWTVSGIDEDVLSCQFREPLGVVAQFLPVHFPVLVAAWNLAPALAVGNCSVVKPASDASWSVLKLAEVIGEVLPPGVVNIVTGRGDGVGRDLDVGARSPSVFFADVLAEEDGFLDRAVEAMVLSAAGEGLVCTCPSRALVHEPAYDEFVGRALERIAELVVDDPLDTATRVGPRGGAEQLARLESGVDSARDGGARVLIGGHRVDVGDEFSDGYFYAPTVLRGHHRMRVFREEVSGPVLAVTTFADEEDAIAIANDSRDGPGAGVWTRDGERAYRVGRAVKAGRVWTDCYHQYAASARYACTPATGAGREGHRLVLDQYSRLKSLVVSHGRRHSGPLAS